MKVSRESGFKPVTITLETVEELKTLNEILRKRNESTRDSNNPFPAWDCAKVFPIDQRELMEKMYRELPSS
jgi:hypothetical protein